MPIPKGPDSVTPNEWAQALADRRHLPFPEAVWPEVVTSFEDLQRREREQLDIAHELENKLRDIRDQIKQTKGVADGLALLEATNNNIRKQMMTYMQQHEVEQLQGVKFSSEEQHMSDHLERLRDRIHGPDGFGAKIHVLELKHALIRDAGDSARRTRGKDVALEQMKTVTDILTTYNDAIAEIDKQLVHLRRKVEIYQNVADRASDASENTERDQFRDDE
jgi:hypothetical protein